MKRKGLGRGLDALLAPGGAEDRLAQLALDTIAPGRYQPRTRMTQEHLLELAASIRQQGVVQPIVVRPAGPGQYEIIAGERRWRAARIADLTEIPAIIREVPDESALALALIENIQREDLNPLEEAGGIKRLIDEFGMTHEQAATAVGRSRSATSNLLRLLNLAPEVQELLHAGKLEMGHARALLALAPARQIEMATSVAGKGLSVRDAERLVGGAARRKSSKRVVAGARVDRDLLRLQEDLSDTLGTTVRIESGRKGAGRILISYTSFDQLDGLLARIRGTTDNSGGANS